MDMLKELQKKSGPQLDQKAKDAKMKVLKEIHKMASDSMGDDIHGLQKVSVMAPDQHGLQKGLDVAKAVAGDSDDPAEEAAESPDEEAQEEGNDLDLNEHSSHPMAQELMKEVDEEADKLSSDDLDALIAKLQEKKAAKGQEA